MSGLDDVLKAIPIQGPLQMAYFWLKNRKRAKQHRKWAKSNGMQFALTGKSFEAPANPHTSDEAELAGEKPLSSQQQKYARMFGSSKIQSQYGQFISNRFRGEWQTDKNICWGAVWSHTDCKNECEVRVRNNGRMRSHRANQDEAKKGGHAR